jgi:hypothetical protein
MKLCNLDVIPFQNSHFPLSPVQDLSPVPHLS